MATTPAVPPFDAAHHLAPAPTTRDSATRDAWIRHYAAAALAAWATFRTETDNLFRSGTQKPGSRPDLGYLALAAVASTSAAVALLEPNDAPGLIWDLTPEAGALNGEWEDWLVDTLVRHGVNPGYIHPDYDPADFAAALNPEPTDQPYVCPTCGDTAYQHFPECTTANQPA